jgi:hypothetical protein
MTGRLYCCAEARDGGWEALCLDLDIAVQGASFEEVYRALNEAVSLYIDCLANLPDRERARLLARKTPLSVRLTVLWSALRTLLLCQTSGCQHATFVLSQPTQRTERG